MLKEMEARMGVNDCFTFDRLRRKKSEEYRLEPADYLVGLENMIELGFEQVEILSDTLRHTMSEADREELFSRLADYRREHDISFSLHLPFWWTDIANPDKRVRKGAVETIRRSVDRAEPAEPEQLVLHVFQNMEERARDLVSDISVRQTFLKRVMEAASRSIAGITADLEKSRLLCLENLVKTDPDRLLELSRRHDTSLTYDVGHEFIRNENIKNYFQQHQRRIASLHIHNIKAGERLPDRPKTCQMQDHRPLEQGLIDYEKFLSFLSDQSFSGTLITEVTGFKPASASAEYLKKLGLIGSAGR